MIKVVEDERSVVIQENRKRQSRQGVLPVLVVVLLLWVGWAVLIVPNISRRSGQAKVAKAMADLSVLAGAVDQFREDCGRYPTNAEGIGSLTVASHSLKGWKGPYLKDITNDPWGNPYRYRAPGKTGRDGYLVESYGADGKPRGEGDDADIFDGSW